MSKDQRGTRFELWQNQITANLVSYILISILWVCFSIAVVWLIEFYFPDWMGSYLPWLTFFVSLEAMYYRRLIRRKSLSLDDREFWIYRGAELVVLLLVVRLLIYFFDGTGTLMSDFQGWPSGWYRFIDNTEFLGVSIFIIITWGISNLFGTDIDRLQTRPTDIHWDTITELDIDRKEARNNLTGRMLTLGMGLLMLTVIFRLSAGQYFGETFVSRAATLNILVYFGVCVILFTQTQFALLRGRWYWENTPVSGDIGLRWFRYTLLFIGFLVCIAFILPTMYANGLLETIRFLISVVGYLFSLISFFLTTLFSLIYGLFLVLTGGDAKPRTIETPTFQLPGTIESSNPQAWFNNPIADWILSISFWLILLLIIGISLKHYLGQHSELFRKIMTIPIFRWVLQFFDWILEGVIGLRGQFMDSVAQRLTSLRNRITVSDRLIKPSYLSLRKLIPREKIIFFYMAFLRRTYEAGISREPYITPNAFRQTVDTFLPVDAIQETRTLTEMFYTARYSNKQIDQVDVIPALSAWRRLREFLRKLQKNG